MPVEAKVITDSVSPSGHRIITMQLRYPRFIHSEFMTHRLFSRNASSSRAIPVKKLIEDIQREPAMPVFWGSNKAGMQAGDELTGDALEKAKWNWLHARDQALIAAASLMEIGLHKQIANRVLEPFSHINVVVTATEWDNFFELRCHPDAQPEMRALAEAIRDAQRSSTPKLLQPGEWHLPYADRDKDRETAWEMARGNGAPEQDPTDGHVNDLLISASVARCARVSYLTHEGKEPNMEDDIGLWGRLVGSVPIHASPAEHQATPDEMGPHGSPSAICGDWNHRDEWGNFVGWRQYRKQLEKQILGVG